MLIIIQHFFNICLYSVVKLVIESFHKGSKMCPKRKKRTKYHRRQNDNQRNENRKMPMFWLKLNRKYKPTNHNKSCFFIIMKYYPSVILFHNLNVLLIHFLVLTCKNNGRHENIPTAKNQKYRSFDSSRNLSQTNQSISIYIIYSIQSEKRFEMYLINSILRVQIKVIYNVNLNIGAIMKKFSIFNSIMYIVHLYTLAYNQESRPQSHNITSNVFM